MSPEHEVVIISAVRIPTGKFLGALSPFSATQLGSIVIREAVRRAGINPQQVDEVIMGNVVSAGLGQAPARQAAIHAGIPPAVPVLTINKVCGSGLKAVMLAAQAIKAGDARCLVAGGMESMSNAPYLLRNARNGYRLGNGELVDADICDGLWCSFENWHMGDAAEFIAAQFGISREEQDEFALESHRKALMASESGKFRDEIVPVEVPHKKGTIIFDTDETPRADTSLEALARLKPAFQFNGTVTPGNAPGLSDGAAALVVMEGKEAERSGRPPLARITAYTAVGIEPRFIFAAPPLAIRKLLSQTGLSLADFDLIEVNEAFSAQILANGKELGWDWNKINVNGGAVALGHPIGASGARILTTLIYALRARGGKRGLASLCLGGGSAIAMSIEVIER
ncbi:MAG: acetyl-CoA C-acetyltransferase [Chloroflexi bacterium]|nr:acetyl-CoA C-acetyltransferase [Chloroflexota bacterium]MCL5074779.1 acetyl-CoA C-acetyltransferase [Chloroflexota bacterium]